MVDQELSDYVDRLSPENRRDLADLLSRRATVKDIALRRDITTKAVYSRCHRFEAHVGRRIKWPWRIDGHRGRKPTKQLAAA